MKFSTKKSVGAYAYLPQERNQSASKTNTSLLSYSVVDDVIVYFPLSFFVILVLLGHPSATYIYLTSYCTLPHILPFVTLHLTLPYHIFCLLLPYLTLHFTLPYLISYHMFCLTLSLTLPFALPYLTLPYILP